MTHEWKKLPYVQGIGYHRLKKLEIYFSTIFPEYQFLVLTKSTLLTDGILARDTMFIRRRDK